ncbi:MAG: GGDEF and EAL domain-containing protein [Lachnospiraceae bacterium]|nr:GGDEF and EAL domain-containing protein [Lachnospiraceae bacterium]
MKKKFSIKDHTAIIVGLLFGFALINAAIISILGARMGGANVFFRLGHSNIPMNSIQGLLQTFALMLCIIMACVDCVVGARMAYFVVAFLGFSSILGMLKNKNLSPLPGVFNCLLSFVAIMIIGYLMRKAKEKSITDYATGSYNAIGFIEQINKRFREKKSGSLIYYQINNFRAINDDYGHEIGDKVLHEVSDRMISVVGKNGIVGRIGGSEFAIMLNDKVDANVVVKELFEQLNKKMVFDNEGVHLDCYIEGNAGIAHFPHDANESNSLFKCADVALMHSMKKGGNNIAVFDENMLSKMHYDKEIEQLIKRAYDEQYFYLEYQPQFTVNDKRLRGFESLIRMHLPDGRRISPGDFIPVAEKSNLIYTIDEFVLDYVTKKFANIARESDITISVNISANGISRPEFVSIVETCLRKNNFAPEKLEIEITEYSFEDSQEQTIINIKKLKELGVKVALDDFGTGYASLSRLMNLSVDLLKVDKSLVDDIEKGEVNRDFINSIGSMGHLLNCKVILEGVETDSQIEYIKDLECDYIQGFVWGKPVSYEKATEMIS